MTAPKDTSARDAAAIASFERDTEGKYYARHSYLTGFKAGYQAALDSAKVKAMVEALQFYSSKQYMKPLSIFDHGGEWHDVDNGSVATKALKAFDRARKDAE